MQVKLISRKSTQSRVFLYRTPSSQQLQKRNSSESQDSSFLFENNAVLVEVESTICMLVISLCFVILIHIFIGVCTGVIMKCKI